MHHRPGAEPHWPPQLTLLVAIGLQILLPDRLDLHPRVVLPALEGVLLVSLVVASPQRVEGPHLLRRRMALALTAIASIANGISLALLCKELFRHTVVGGHQLIIAGALIWLTNVLVFSLWYWELDSGGPGQRAAQAPDTPDFLFPQTTDPQLVPGWKPTFPDYLYVSLTNATAFSPTDTMPLSVAAKMVMGLQSLISLVTIGLVISRAVNIL